MSSESHVTQEDGEGHTSENKGVETYAYIHTTYILPNASRQHVSRSTVLSKNVKSQKDGSNYQLPCKGTSRGGTIEPLLHDNQLEIPIPDWSWKGVPIWFLYMNSCKFVYVGQHIMSFQNLCRLTLYVAWDKFVA